MMKFKEEHYWHLPSGRRVCYAEYGDPEGAPLFFFHGWPSSRIQARVLHEDAVELGLRVIAPDRPGLGRSDFAGRRELKEWPVLVEGLADHLSIERFRVFGYSGGGPYAIACAAWLGHRVERVAIVCGAPPLERFPERSDMLWAYRALLSARKRYPRVLGSLVKLSGKLCDLPPRRAPMKWFLRSLPSVDREAMECHGGYESYFEVYREALRQGPEGVVMDAEVYLEPWDLEFESIRVPMSFWHGEEDRNIPIRMARDIAGWIPDAVFRPFRKDGHYSLILNRRRQILEELCGSRVTIGLGAD